METRDDLLRRLTDLEDQFTERKLEGVGSSDIKKAIVAFANSVPSNRTGLFFIGVADDGQVKGVKAPDSLQKTIRRLAENECYPPIFVDMVVLEAEGTPIVVVSVSHSTRRPHFTGPAYIRRGSESIAATAELYEELILSRNDLRRALFERRDEIWTVFAVGKQIGSPHPMNAGYTQVFPARITEVTAHYVRLLIDGSRNATEPLDGLRLSFDDQNHRPMLIARFVP